MTDTPVAADVAPWVPVIVRGPAVPNRMLLPVTVSEASELVRVVDAVAFQLSPRESVPVALNVVDVPAPTTVVVGVMARSATAETYVNVTDAGLLVRPLSTPKDEPPPPPPYVEARPP